MKQYISSAGTTTSRLFPWEVQYQYNPIKIQDNDILLILYRIENTVKVKIYFGHQIKANAEKERFFIMGTYGEGSIWDPFKKRQIERFFRNINNII